MGAGVTNPVGTSATVVIGRDLSTGSQLINPSAAVGRPVTSEGNADFTTSLSVIAMPPTH
jgi:hypothetical protein